jgi:catechol 2,3-dioxygenase-like lactoylglutathione lyase family enzyme
VKDLGVSRRFYAETFGFVETYSRVVDSQEFARLLGYPEIRAEVAIMSLEGQRIELLCIRSPAVIPQPFRPSRMVGFTHLAFNVSDLDEIGARIERLGGKLSDDRRLEVAVNGEARFYVIGNDPDGTPIELIKGSVLG